MLLLQTLVLVTIRLFATAPVGKEGTEVEALNSLITNGKAVNK